MPTSMNPSGLLAESLAAFSNSAHQAFAEVENQARRDVAQATADAREARLERDRALESLHVCQLEWQKEVASVKSMLKQAETSISHHKETIAQLRREATQWKDQSRNWQEHFLRVEQERCSLTTRIEEMVAEQNQWSHTLATIRPADESASLVTSFNQPPGYKDALQTSPPDVDSPSTSISGHKHHRIQTKRTQTPRKCKSSSRSPTRHLSRSTVIRRVQAVIHVKKEESDNDESGRKEPEDTIEHDATKNVKSSPQRRRKAVPDDDEYVPGDEVPLSDFEQSDHGEAWQGQVGDEEDDELMLGAEENHRGIAVKSLKNKSLTSSASKKRKLPGSAGHDKAPTRRKVYISAS